MSSSLNTVASRGQYGLVKKGGLSAKPNVQRAKLPLSAFKDELEDDDDHDSSKNFRQNEISRVNQQLKQENANSKLKDIMGGKDNYVKNALKEDPNIFDYDGSYDDFKATNEKKTHVLSQATNDPPKSRYLNSLLATAKMREKENDRVYEKILLKERNDDEFKDHPKFITNAYKKKLIEDEKWEYENKLAEKLDEHTDVRKSGMQGFYSNLLTKNISMGGNVDANAISIFTAGSNRQNKFNDMADNNNDNKNNSSNNNNNNVEVDDVKYISDNKSRDYDDKKDEQEEIPEEQSNINNNNNNKVPIVQEEQVPKLSKEEQIAQARNRYLTRKRNIEETNN